MIVVGVGVEVRCLLVDVPAKSLEDDDEGPVIICKAKSLYSAAKVSSPAAVSLDFLEVFDPVPGAFLFEDP